MYNTVERFNTSVFLLFLKVYNNLINDLNAIETANKPLNDEFFNKWTKFDTYRKIIFKDEVWEYVI